MKTNFTHARKLVLTNEQDRPVAIINCEAGKSINILPKLEQAIKEDRGASQVNITDNIDIYEGGFETSFTAHVYEPEGEDVSDYYEDYKLYFTQEY